MNPIIKPRTDADWDYSSIWDIVKEAQIMTSQIMILLSSDEADAGNEKIDVQILEMVARIKGDCIGIEKALKSEEELKVPTPSIALQHQDSIVQSSRESVSLLRSMDLTLSHVDEVLSKISASVSNKAH